MRKPRQKEKALQARNYKFRKQYYNAYHLSSDAYLNNLLKTIKRELNQTAPFPLTSIKEIKKADYHNYKKIIHYTGLFNLRPPFWFRNQALNCLINTLEKWKTYAEALKQDYYLKLWIYEDEFSRSEIVFALNDRLRRYNSIFDLNENDCALPFLTHEIQNKLMKYNIQFCKETYPFDAEDLEDKQTSMLAKLAIKMGYQLDKILLYSNESALKNIDRFLESGFIRQFKQDGEHFYDIHIDNIWVIESK